MLDFRPQSFRARKRSRRVPNYLSRREQWRLLVIVGALGLVVLLMTELARPGRWQWMWNSTRVEAAHSRSPETRLPDDRRQRLPGRFVAEAPIKAAPAHGHRAMFAGVRADLLAEVRDDTVFRPAEALAFYQVLDLVKRTGPQALRRASQGRATRTQLFAQPAAYRGRVVTIEGRARRAFRLDAAANDYAIEHYYQVWLEPAHEADPIVAYCLALPGRFPTGMNLDEPVQVTGIFFKRWAYLAGDGIRTAPLLLAGEPDWRPSDVGRPAAADEPLDLAVPLAVATGVSLLVVLLVLGRTTRIAPLGRKRAGPTAGRQPEAPSDEEVRRQLAALDEDSSDPT